MIQHNAETCRNFWKGGCQYIATNTVELDVYSIASACLKPGLEQRIAWAAGRQDVRISAFGL